MKMNNIDSSSIISEDSFLGVDVNIWKNVRVVSSILKGKNSIGDFSQIRNSKLGYGVTLQKNCTVIRSEIGDYCWIEKNAELHDIKIGKFCEIAWYCNGGGDNHNYKMPSMHYWYWNPIFGFEDNINNRGHNKMKQQLLSEYCEIGNDVWIGSNVTINRNVRIGNGVVIGAGSVVTKDIPDYAVVVGVPAKVIKYRFRKDIIKRLLLIEWWNWPHQVLVENRHLFEVELNEDTLVAMEKVKFKL